VKYLIPVSLLALGTFLLVFPLLFMAIAHIEMTISGTGIDAIFTPMLMGAIMVGFGIYFSFRCTSGKS
jgi:uncharacterized membrane protein YedE/YeeE